MATPTTEHSPEMELFAGRVEYQVSRRIDALTATVDKNDARHESHRVRTDEKLDNIYDLVSDIRANMKADEAVLASEVVRKEQKHRIREFVIATASFVALACSVGVPILIH